MSKQPYDKIYLIGWYDEYPRPTDFGDEVTWCQDSIGDNDECPDIEYIRADIANQRIAELEENRTMLQRVVSVLRNVAFEYDNDWRENSPRWLRYLEALQPKEKRNEN